MLHLSFGNYKYMNMYMYIGHISSTVVQYMYYVLLYVHRLVRYVLTAKTQKQVRMHVHVHVF